MTLAGRKRVAIDLGVFEAWLRGRSTQALALFEGIEAGKPGAVTSVLTLTALLAQAEDERAAEELGFLLPTFPHLELVPVDLAVASKAAGFQTRYGLEPGPALQAATAKVMKADLFVTADPGMERLAGELEIMLLDDFAGP